MYTSRAGRVGEDREEHLPDSVQERGHPDRGDLGDLGPQGAGVPAQVRHVLGRFPDEVSIKEGNLYVVGRQVPMISEKDVQQPPWATSAWTRSSRPRRRAAPGRTWRSTSRRGRSA